MGGREPTSPDRAGAREAAIQKWAGAREGQRDRVGASERQRRRRLCLRLVAVVTEHPSAYGPLLRRHGGLESLLAQRELALPGGQPAADRSQEGGGRCLPAKTGSRDMAVAVAKTVAGSAAVTGGGDGERLLVAYIDDRYPAALGSLFDPPPALFVAGVAATERLAATVHRPLVAVVGTRAPSRYGREMASAIARGLGHAGVCVVSGLALGVDALAHQAALQACAAAPATVAVLGCGADVVYPRTNARLYRQVAERGLVISEYPWGTPTRPWRFPARNRIIAGLSRAVVVVEGASDSGSLSTAEYALDIGRPVFAVPGEAGRRLSAAPHGLLRAGAHLCESADDVLSLLGLDEKGPAWTTGLTWCGDPDAASGGTVDGGLRRAVLRLLDEGEAAVDELAVRVSVAASEVVATLGVLEVEGLVQAEGGRYRLVRGRARKD
jgi:DNA processing protein